MAMKPARTGLGRAGVLHVLRARGAWLPHAAQTVHVARHDKRLRV
jgi:hypothetical protein